MNVRSNKRITSFVQFRIQTIKNFKIIHEVREKKSSELKFGCVARSSRFLKTSKLCVLPRPLSSNCVTRRTSAQVKNPPKRGPVGKFTAEHKKQLAEQVRFEFLQKSPFLPRFLICCAIKSDEI
jgi:hypothetical protein